VAHDGYFWRRFLCNAKGGPFPSILGRFPGAPFGFIAQLSRLAIVSLATITKRSITEMARPRNRATT